MVFDTIKIANFKKKLKSKGQQKADNPKRQWVGQRSLELRLLRFQGWRQTCFTRR